MRSILAGRRAGRALVACSDFAWLSGFAAAGAIAADGVAELPSPQLAAFAGSLVPQALFLALGLYGREAEASESGLAARVALCALAALALLRMALEDIAAPGASDEALLLALATVAAGHGAALAARLALREARVATPVARRVLLVGGGADAARMRAAIDAIAGARFRVAGAVDPSGRMAPGAIEAAARALAVDEIVVAAADRRGLPVDELMRCRTGGVPVRDAAMFLEAEAGRIDVRVATAGWIAFGGGFVHGAAFRAAKRCLDVAASVLLLVATLPLTLAVAALLAAERGGPVLYRQERVGLDGRSFMLLKFRTMRADAEREGPRWAAAADPRVTPLGRFLRRARIDEIPQALNVLRGDMSFVGPRPERPVFVHELAARIPFYAERHRVKPGITGWAQVNYPYGASVEDAREKLAYDLYYAKNASLLLDLAIILRTARVVLSGAGAR
jgi:sugar transferase (PEP-CTERM system associated)